MAATSTAIRNALKDVGGWGGQGWSARTLGRGADKAMRQAGITTRKGAAVFVAQCMVESAYFRTTREYGGPATRYAPYYGRGFIQVTWESNYRNFGKWCANQGLVPSPDYFLSPHEDRLAHASWAWLGAVWYFRTHAHGLVGKANDGKNVQVGRAINRGSAYSDYAAYGEDERQAAYRALLAAGIDAPGGSSRSSGGSSGGSSGDRLEPDGIFGQATIRALQDHLGVTADGIFGDNTKRALQRWLDVSPDGMVGPRTIRALQRRVGATVDGRWGHGTTRALQRWLNRNDADRLEPDGIFGQATIRALQDHLGVTADGIFGDNTKRALQRWLDVSPDGMVGPRTIRALQRRVGATVDGRWGHGTTRALQRWLNRTP